MSSTSEERENIWNCVSDDARHGELVNKEGGKCKTMGISGRCGMGMPVESE